LKSFIDLNNEVLGKFTPDERARIGIHTCPGGDLDSTHSLEVDYAELLPTLFELDAGIFYIRLASEPDRRRVLNLIKDHAPAHSRIFVGVIDPIDPRVETPEEVRDRVLEAADYIPLDRLGTCDDCGFSPFGDDTSTSRETAVAKITARVQGHRDGCAGSRSGVVGASSARKAAFFGQPSSVAGNAAAESRPGLSGATARSLPRSCNAM
jgi:5-methyltetrahydropteroyltriglutamate--homocysteine methyltransferase